MPLLRTDKGSSIYVGHLPAKGEFDHEGRRRWNRLLQAALDVALLQYDKARGGK